MGPEADVQPSAVKLFTGSEDLKNCFQSIGNNNKNQNPKRSNAAYVNNFVLLYLLCKHLVLKPASVRSSIQKIYTTNVLETSSGQNGFLSLGPQKALKNGTPEASNNR